MEKPSNSLRALHQIRERLLDIQRDGRIDAVVFAFGPGLAAGSARVVMILSGSARLQLAAPGDLHFLDDRFPGLEFWHRYVLKIIPKRSAR